MFPWVWILLSLRYSNQRYLKLKENHILIFVTFLNKNVKFISVRHIFHDPSVTACLPTDIKFDDPTLVYLSTNPVRSKIFNFDKFIVNLDVKAFLQDNTNTNFSGSGLLRALNLEKPITFHEKKLNPLKRRNAIIVLIPDATKMILMNHYS